MANFDMPEKKIATCLWFDHGQAYKAAEFYAATSPDSHVNARHLAPSDYPDGKQGNELTVEFTVLGMPFVGLNGGPQFKFNEAISFQVYTDGQEETDRYWNAIVGNNGEESRCGWCKDKFGLSWQIVPRAGREAGRVSLQLFGHPLSSYTMKALIALYENETPFDFRILDPDHPANAAELDGAGQSPGSRCSSMTGRRCSKPARWAPMGGRRCFHAGRRSRCARAALRRLGAPDRRGSHHA